MVKKTCCAAASENEQMLVMEAEVVATEEQIIPRVLNLPNSQQPRHFSERNMKQRIVSYRMPLCQRRPVTAQQCFAALQHFQTSTECCLEFIRMLLNAS